MDTIENRVKDLRWTKVVKQRDVICRRCGFAINLHAHHIKPKRFYPHFRTCLNKEVTLCGNCHSKITVKEESIALR